MIAQPPTTRPDHRTLPRKKRAPSSRDQAIYLAYRAGGKTQAQLAEDNHLSQRRISEIIRRVERWRADLVPAAAAGELQPDQQARLERYLEQQRLQGIYDRAIRAYDTQPKELKSTRQGDRDGKSYHDETTREQPPNVQLLKVALKAATDLGKLSDKLNDKPPTAAADQKDVEQRFWQAHDLLRELRREAGIPQDESLWSKDFAAVTDALNNLLRNESAVECTSEAPCTSSEDAPRGADIPVCHEDTAADPASETLNPGYPLGARTLNPPSSSRANCSNVAPIDGTASKTAAPAETLSPEPTSNDALISSTPTSPPKKKSKPPEPPPSRYERWERHQEKLAQWREALRTGLPCMIHFNPEDGPVPKAPVIINDFGYQPTAPPTSAEIRAEHAAYLEKLRAEHQRNK